MTPNNEQRILASMEELKETVSEINTKLFGSAEGNPEGEGRLPLLERRMDKYGDRIGNLEHSKWVLIGALLVGQIVLAVVLRYVLPPLK